MDSKNNCVGCDCTPPLARYVVRNYRTGRTVYQGWTLHEAAQAAGPGTVLGVGGSFLQAEAAATYQICQQWRRLGITGTNTEVR